MQSGRARVTTLVTTLVSLWAATAAASHPLVEQGRALLDEADFAGALSALREAEAQGGLDRADLILLLETRALVHGALGDEAEADAAWQALASVEPDHRFAPEVSPDVVRRFSQLRDAGPGPLELDVAQTPAPGGTTLSAEVRGDVTGMVHAITVHARVGRAAWQRSDEGRLTLRAEPGARVDWYAVAHGPGGAPVARLGSEHAPRQVQVEGLAVVTTDPGSSDELALWIGLGSAAVVLAVAAVVLGVVFGGGGESAVTQVEAPMWPVL